MRGEVGFDSSTAAIQKIKSPLLVKARRGLCYYRAIKNKKGGPLVPKIDNYSGTAYEDPIPWVSSCMLAHFCYDRVG